MGSLSEADKNYLKLLILDCKTFHLNETESIAYISNKLNSKITRTLYYNCKKEMSDNLYHNVIRISPGKIYKIF